MKRREEHERAKVNSVAADYKKRGYRVWLEPTSSELPGNLRSFHPDLIATSEHDSVVVEVKSRTSLANDSQLSLLADAVQKMRGWRFELVVTNPESQQQHHTGTSLSQPEIIDRAQQAQRLFDEGFVEAAYMTAWSAVEAMLRETAYRLGIELPNVTPLAVLKTLRSQGALTKDAYDKLIAAMFLRNSVAHGFSPIEDPGPHLQNMLSLTEELRLYNPSGA